MYDPDEKSMKTSFGEGVGSSTSPPQLFTSLSRPRPAVLQRELDGARRRADAPEVPVAAARGDEAALRLEGHAPDLSSELSDE